MNKTKLILLIGLISAITVVSLSAGYLLASRLITGSRQTSVTAATIKPTPQVNPQTTPSPTNDENPFLAQIMPTDDAGSNEPWSVKAVQTIFRLMLAVLLSGVLAFRPRRNVPLLQRNLYVAQTQILLAVVAAALMLIVGDNTARAFAIFAAVSLVRFRTNIRDPKEITVLLISLALGLAAGVGRWELGITLCLFVLILLWILEYKESDQVFRSMELTVKTRNTEATQNVLKQIFNSYKLEAEVRQIDPPDESDDVGCIMYYLNLRVNISTDSLSDKIFASDASNIEGISWKHQKTVSYV